MAVVGIVAEYNPLHHGHAWHLALTRQALKAEAIVVVMSGHFTQRGEPAIVDKWSRAAMAIASGADLVFELPTIYACSRAPWFAHGAISLLDQLNIVTHLSFGSEAGELDELVHAAAILEQDPPQLRVRARELAKVGLSHPRAQAEALAAMGAAGYSPTLLSTANNILAVEYLRALLQQQSRIAPWTTKRQGAGYHDLDLGPLASATAIRRAILASSSDTVIADSLPQSSLKILKQQLGLGRGPVTWGSLDVAALAWLRRSTDDQLAQLPEVSEGLEHRLIALADAPSVEQWLLTAKTKRYTRARLTRTLTHLLLGVTKTDLGQMQQPIPYARLLAMNSVGRALLRRCREKSPLPIIHKPKSTYASLTAWGRRLLDLDRLAADLWVLGAPNPAERHGAQDLTHEPVRVF